VCVCVRVCYECVCVWVRYEAGRTHFVFRSYPLSHADLTPGRPPINRMTRSG
jgi:hypothetical protein